MLSPRSFRPPPPRPKPSSPSWFTGKPTYVDILRRLDATTHDVRQRLWSSRILPSYNATPSEALEQLGLRESVGPRKRGGWATPEDMARIVSLKVRDAQYRSLIARLDRLRDLLPHARVADQLGASGYGPVSRLSATISDAIAPFNRQSAGIELPMPKQLGHVDELGRAYAVGRRKTASVRVWMIPVKRPFSTDADAAAAPSEIGAVLVNKLSLPEALPYPSDRALALRPFVVTRTLGRYNVFAIANGGGTTGWAGALQLGIAKCLAQLVGPVARAQLKQGAACSIGGTEATANLLRRDPRLVLRKMPGKPKHSKANQWVRHGHQACLTSPGQALDRRQCILCTIFALIPSSGGTTGSPAARPPVPTASPARGGRSTPSSTASTSRGPRGQARRSPPPVAVAAAARASPSRTAPGSRARSCRG